MTRLLTTVVALVLTAFVLGVSIVLLIVGKWRGAGTVDPVWYAVVALLFVASEWAIWKSWRAAQETRGYRD